ncbi:MAG: response regulator [Patescibacteria group bacterium]
MKGQKTMAKNTKRRILVVDDEPDFLQSLQEFLEIFGFEVVTAGNYIHALARFADSGPYFAIISDYNLGEGKNGVDLITQIITYFGKEKFTLLIMMSGNDSELRADLAAARVKVDKIFPKPFDVNELVNELNKT